jgi:hypothetical protein
MPAHEVDAMAAIGRTDIDGLGVRRQGYGSGQIGRDARRQRRRRLHRRRHRRGLRRYRDGDRIDLGHSANSCTTDSVADAPAFCGVSIGGNDNCARGQSSNAARAVSAPATRTAPKMDQVVFI